MVSVHASHIRQISQNASSLFHIGSICIHWMYSYIRFFFIKVNRKLEFHKYLHGDLSKESIYLNTNFQPNWAILKKKKFSRTLSISGQHTAYIRNFSRSFSKCVDFLAFPQKNFLVSKINYPDSLDTNDVLGRARRRL